MARRLILILAIACVSVMLITLTACELEPKGDRGCPSADETESAVTASVIFAPIPFHVRDGVALGYEVVTSDYAAMDYSLAKVEVYGDDELIATYEGDDLAEMTIAPEENTAFAGAIVLLWPTFESESDVPEALSNRLYFESNGSDDETMTYSADTTVTSQSALTLEPPVYGDRWLALNGPGNLTGHHRASLLMFQSAPYISQRFAIDWVQFGESGNVWAGDGTANEDHYAYGANLLAVAGGEVVDVKDGYPEQLPFEDPPYPVALDNAGGNYVILKLAEGVFAFYGHLIPGSAQVQVGDMVTAGDTLGLLGNSGNSTMPHLHIHICNANSGFIAQGMPYAINSYGYYGTLDSYEGEEGDVWSDTGFDTTQAITNQLPENNDVVDFGEAEETAQ